MTSDAASERTQQVLPVVPERSPLACFAECPQCGGALRPEHAHFRCPQCGWRDSCCD